MVAFRGGFHGRTQGALSCSSSRADLRAGWGGLGTNVHISPFPRPSGDGQRLEDAAARARSPDWTTSIATSWSPR